MKTVRSPLLTSHEKKLINTNSKEAGKSVVPPENKKMTKTNSMDDETLNPKLRVPAWRVASAWLYPCVLVGKNKTRLSRSSSGCCSTTGSCLATSVLQLLCLCLPCSPCMYHIVKEQVKELQERFPQYDNVSSYKLRNCCDTPGALAQTREFLSVMDRTDDDDSSSSSTAVHHCPVENTIDRIIENNNSDDEEVAI